MQCVPTKRKEEAYGLLLRGEGTKTRNGGVAAPALEWKLWWKKVGGAPDRIRTYDLLIRSQTLYPTELRVHGGADERT